MLPQQPSYTIHTSQAVTTAHFSEAEESTDGDDTDDRLSGKKSAEEARKEQVRKSPEYQHPERISRNELTAQLR
jgi:hypothetical protein